MSNKYDTAKKNSTNGRNGEKTHSLTEAKRDNIERNSSKRKTSSTQNEIFPKDKINNSEENAHTTQVFENKFKELGYLMENVKKMVDTGKNEEPEDHLYNTKTISINEENNFLKQKIKSSYKEMEIEFNKCKDKLEDTQKSYKKLQNQSNLLIAAYNKIISEIFKIQSKDFVNPKIKKDLSDMRNVFFKKLMRYMVTDDEDKKSEANILKAELELKDKLLQKSLKVANNYASIIEKQQVEEIDFKKKFEGLFESCGAMSLFFGEVVATEKFSNKTGNVLIFGTVPPNNSNFCEIKSLELFRRLKKTKYYMYITSNGSLQFYHYANDVINKTIEPDFVISIEGQKDILSLKSSATEERENSSEDLEGNISEGDIDENLRYAINYDGKFSRVISCSKKYIPKLDRIFFLLSILKSIPRVADVKTTGEQTVLKAENDGLNWFYALNNEMTKISLKNLKVTKDKVFLDKNSTTKVMKFKFREKEEPTIGQLDPQFTWQVIENINKRLSSGKGEPVDDYTQTTAVVAGSTLGGNSLEVSAKTIGTKRNLLGQDKVLNNSVVGENQLGNSKAIGSTKNNTRIKEFTDEFKEFRPVSDASTMIDQEVQTDIDQDTLVQNYNDKRDAIDKTISFLDNNLGVETTIKSTANLISNQHKKNLEESQFMYSEKKMGSVWTPQKSGMNSNVKSPQKSVLQSNLKKQQSSIPKSRVPYESYITNDFEINAHDDGDIGDILESDNTSQENSQEELNDSFNRSPPFKSPGKKTDSEFSPTRNKKISGFGFRDPDSPTKKVTIDTSPSMRIYDKENNASDRKNPLDSQYSLDDDSDKENDSPSSVTKRQPNNLLESEISPTTVGKSMLTLGGGINQTKNDYLFLHDVAGVEASFKRMVVKAIRKGIIVKGASNNELDEEMLIRVQDSYKNIERVNLKTKKRFKRRVKDQSEISHIFDPEAKVDDQGGISLELTTFLYKDNDKWEMKVKKGLSEKCFFFDCLNIFMWNMPKIKANY